MKEISLAETTDYKIILHYPLGIRRLVLYDKINLVVTLSSHEKQSSVLFLSLCTHTAPVDHVTAFAYIPNFTTKFFDVVAPSCYFI